jgi:hypothetical protein
VVEPPEKPGRFTLMTLGIGVFVYGLQHYLRERGPSSQLKQRSFRANATLL